MDDESGIHENHSRLDRREFIKRTGGAVVTAAALGAAASWLYDRQPELKIGAADTARDAIQLNDYSIDRTAEAVRLAIAHGEDPVSLLEPALKAIGGIETFITRGDVVVVKPNVAFASPPLIGATSHPGLVGAVVKQVLAAGAAQVIVTDNPINQPEQCFDQSGIGPAVLQAGGQLFIPKKDDFKPITVSGGELIRDWPFLAGPFKRTTKVIGVAPIKDHRRALASMSLKNWYGLLGGRRNQFHQDIHNIIKELAMMMRPTLVILDGTRVMMQHGPTGGSLSDLTQKNTLIAATDPIAADAVGYTLLGRDPAKLDYLRMASDLGLGHWQYKTIPYEEFHV